MSGKNLLNLSDKNINVFKVRNKCLVTEKTYNYFSKCVFPSPSCKTSYPLKKTEGYNHLKEQDLHLWLMKKWQMQTQTFFQMDASGRN